MKTMFRTGGYEKAITTIEVIRITDSNIWFMDDNHKETRELKRSGWRQWHETWEGAKKFLVDKAIKKVENLQKQFEIAKSELRQIKQLSEGK